MNPPKTIQFKCTTPGVWTFTMLAEQHELEVILSKSNPDGAPTWMCVVILDDRRPSAPCLSADHCDYGKATVVAGQLIPCESCAEKNWCPIYRATWGLPVARVVAQAKYEMTAINRWERLQFIAAIVGQRWSFPATPNCPRP